METRVAPCSLYNRLVMDAITDTLLVENVQAWMPVYVFTTTVF
jgi:hypothetical protein